MHKSTIDVFSTFEVLEMLGRTGATTLCPAPLDCRRRAVHRSRPRPPRGSGRDSPCLRAYLAVPCRRRPRSETRATRRAGSLFACCSTCSRQGLRPSVRSQGRTLVHFSAPTPSSHTPAARALHLMRTPPRALLMSATRYPFLAPSNPFAPPLAPRH